MKKSVTLKYLGAKFDRSLSFNHHEDLSICKTKSGGIKNKIATDVKQTLMFILFNHLVVSVIG